MALDQGDLLRYLNEIMWFPAGALIRVRGGRTVVDSISAYGEFDGIRVPFAGEALYSHDSGDPSYIRLTVCDVGHSIPQRY